MENYLKPSVANIIVDEFGNEYSSARKLAKELGISKSTILKRLKKGEKFVYAGVTYYLKDVNYVENTSNNEKKVVAVSKTEEQKEVERIINSEEYKGFIEAKSVSELPFEKYTFDVDVKEGGKKYAIALFSDAHVEETVRPDTVLGLNEYNLEVAEERIQKYFVKKINRENNKAARDQYSE